MPLDSVRGQGFVSRPNAGIAALVGVQLSELKYRGREVDVLEEKLTNQPHTRKMCVEGNYRLTGASELAYDEKGAGNVIPPVASSFLRSKSSNARGGAN